MSLQDRIKAIYALDDARTQGELTAYDNYVHIELTKDSTYFEAGESPVFMQFYINSDNQDDTSFYAEAPSMVSIIRELEAENKKLQGLVGEK